MTSVPADRTRPLPAVHWPALASWCRAHALMLWAIWFIGFATLSAIWPRDGSYDVLHYQIHNGWAALHGRLGIDHAPANLHSFFNPHVQLATWWLIEHLPGPAVAFLLGLAHAAVLPALYWFCRNLTRAAGMGERQLTCVLVALAGMGAEPVLKMFASVRNDHLGATAFLAALALCMPPDGRAPNARRLALAGGLVGLLFGLKPTNAVYVVGLAVMVMVMVPGLMGRTRAALVTGLAGVAGILAGGGAWYAELWSRFGNPVFPTLDNIFCSPLGPGEGFAGYVRVPETLTEALTLPLRGAVDGSVVNWYATTDLRLAIVYLAALALLTVLAWRRGPARSPDAPVVPVAPIATRPVLAFALMILVTLFAWMASFATDRYAMALWALAPLAAVLLARAVRPRLFDTPRGLLLGLAGLVVLFQTTTPARLNRHAWLDWSERYVWAERPAGFPESGAFILFTDEQGSTFVAPALGTGHVYGHVPVVDWAEPSLANYRPAMLSALRAHEGPVYIATHALGDLEKVKARTLAATGLALDLDTCRLMRTSIYQELHLPDRGRVARGVLLCPATRD